MEEFNFRFTKEEADRIVQSLSIMNNGLINKMQEQFMAQVRPVEMPAEENKVEENSKDD